MLHLRFIALFKPLHRHSQVFNHNRLATLYPLSLHNSGTAPVTQSLGTALHRSRLRDSRSHVAPRQEAVTDSHVKLTTDTQFFSKLFTMSTSPDKQRGPLQWQYNTLLSHPNPENFHRIRTFGRCEIDSIFKAPLYW